MKPMSDPVIAPPPVAEPVAPTASAETPVVSEAVTKFKSCRWRRPPEDGPECCGHRDVLPMAGTTGFDPAGVVSGLLVLQAPPDAEEALSGRIPILVMAHR
jgi:hypothetical protein